jgi:gluconate 2-dehydrogenase alpha chain
MATRLKDTEVVIIGLGAAGGVAALPIAQAGIDNVALEAGTWLTKRDFSPDELRNNVRDWPQAVQKAQHEIPTQRVSARGIMFRASSHPMMNAVGGTTNHYWAQSWRLNRGTSRVVSETTKRYGASRVPKGSTVEDWPFGLDELERTTIASSTRLACRARRATSEARSIAGAISSRARGRVRSRCRRCVGRASRT